MSRNDIDNINTIKVYQDKKTKAEDFKSSAYTLFIAGVLGIAALVLMETGVLPFRLAAPGKYITYVVMGALFVIFIIMGISSFISAKKYAKEAETEEDLTDRIKSWARENITADRLRQQAYFAEDTPEEARYFQYFAALKDAVGQEFDGLNASYLEAVCEELYAELFEDGEKE
ncbi:MAG: hypothetical protein NC337_02780 [Roseburia sp.]|nr:hypothetical protein [Roseburia sp.]